MIDGILSAIDALPDAPVSVVVVRVADVHAQPISWLWPGRIALGKLTLLSGDPGLGKSLLTVALAAHVTSARPWPVDRSRCPRGSVLMLSAEDDIADTLRPRLEAAGADVARVHVLQMVRDLDRDGTVTMRGLSLRRDLSLLDDLLMEHPDIRLVVVDPISAYLGDTDSHNNADVRGTLAPLAELASRHRVALVAVSHLNKSAGPALYRTSGSLAFVAAARAAFVVVKDKDDPGRRLVLPQKNNLGRDIGGLAYRVEQADNGAPMVGWEPDPVMVTAEEAMAPAASDEDRSALDDAKGFLQGLLEGGPVPAKQIEREATGAGHSMATIRRAKAALGIEAMRDEFGKAGVWRWHLPKVLTPPLDAQPNGVSGLGSDEHLSGSDAWEEGAV